jgi:hypothetical protein
MSMHVVGIDLAGPAGAANTGAACFAVGDGVLRFVSEQSDGSDVALRALVHGKANEGPVVVGGTSVASVRFRMLTAGPTFRGRSATGGPQRKPRSESPSRLLRT